MIHAYDEVYLDRAREVMACMLDYAVHVLGYGLVEPLVFIYRRRDY